MTKKIFAFAAFAFLAIGCLVGCSEEGGAKKRATEFMETLKANDFLLAAKMVMNLDKEAELGEQKQWTAEMIQREFEAEFQEPIESYEIGEVTSRVTSNNEEEERETIEYAVNIVLKNGTECTSTIKVRKYKGEDWGEVSIGDLEVTKASEKVVNPADAGFVLGDGKLGPLAIGQTVESLPQSVDGLYDSYKYDQQVIENEMEGSWTEEWVYFYKGGKEIFKSFAENKTIGSFVLEEGSSFISTTEGYYVGYSARELFSKKRLNWETWYMGTAFARDGHWEYHIPTEGLEAADFPSKLDDIKPSATISQIVYYKELPE